jgi:hypothetical protein
MKREEYLKDSLRDLKAELAHETDFVKSIKKSINDMRRAGCDPSDSFEEVIAEGETKISSLTRAITKLEEVIKAKK